ncbi:PQQ-binding-like beta-propeller repeat protein [bacterium]|nr:PQQ-binding-like beta-propeller repeat protein [bacterium]
MASISRRLCIVTIILCVFAVWSGWLFAAETQDFSFVVFSDVHIPSHGFPIGQPLDEESLMKIYNPQRIKQFVDEYLTLSPEPAFVINCGDTGDVGWTALLQLYVKLMQPIVSSGIPVYTVVGNHELDYTGITSEDLAEIFDPLGPSQIGRHGTRYSFDYGGCHFVFLNNRPISGLIRLNPDELEWLRSDLKSIRKNIPVLLFLHANMLEDDTCKIVEILQPYEYPVIFQGHRHTAGIGQWGGVPVVLTGSLYGGKPEAGSYRIVTVKSGRITVRNRDFAQPAGTLDPEEVIEVPAPGPRLSIKVPKKSIRGDAAVVQAEIKPVVSGVVECCFPGFGDWAPMTGGKGKWKLGISLPAPPGRHFLAVRFKGDDGAVVLAHTVIEKPGEGVSQVWEKNLGSAVMGTPVIQGDLAFIPSVEGGVYALRLRDGKEVWHRKGVKGQILGGMAADSGMLYYGEGRTVYACDVKSGKLLWQTPLEASIVAGITAGDGRLYVPAGERKLFCLDARNGMKLWDYSADLPIIMEPATNGSMVFFGAMDGYFRALDSKTGTEVWISRMSAMEDNYTTAPFWPPVIAGDKVIVSKIPAGKEELNLVAFSAADGKRVWSRQLSAGTYRLALNPEKTRLFTPFSQNDRRGVQCLSVEDGSLMWDQPDGLFMNAACATGKELLVRDGGSICGIVASTGQVKWTYRTTIGPQGSYYGPGAMAVSDTMVIVGTMDGYVLALKWQP